MSDAKTRILFVCMGNICRSPAAENVMRSLIAAEGVEDKFELDSAGTIDLHTGKSPDDRMGDALRNRGIASAGKARQVKPGDFETFDWIFAMDEDNYQDLLTVRERAGQPTAKLVKFCDFCEEFDVSDVPDPYYGGLDGFELVLDILEDGCAALLKKFNK
ncbi:MAG: low molecular weight phosphotyrosine protein phosphatase [Verrucomicrobiales bacterium]|nr:low molecular weight phosphotyrosine protein phosphatase [Verrucomicrobiales bacterium]